MNAFAAIRNKLDVTQTQMAEALGVTQGNVSFYEKGQTVPPKVAALLIKFARSKGVPVTYDDIYTEVKPKRASTKRAARKPERAAAV